MATVEQMAWAARYLIARDPVLAEMFGGLVRVVDEGLLEVERSMWPYRDTWRKTQMRSDRPVVDVEI